MDADPAQSSIPLQLLLIVILTLINAYFAASEMAIVSVNKNRIHRLAEEGNRKARLVEKASSGTNQLFIHDSGRNYACWLFQLRQCCHRNIRSSRHGTEGMVDSLRRDDFHGGCDNTTVLRDFDIW